MPREWRQTGVSEGADRVEMAQPGGSKALVAEVLSLSGGDRSAPVALIGATGTRGARM